jgi:hypothetical protein
MKSMGRVGVCWLLVDEMKKKVKQAYLLGLDLTRTDQRVTFETWIVLQVVTLNSSR